MAQFDNAIDYVLSNEGGFQKNPKDTGNYDENNVLQGTNYGITVKVAHNAGYYGPMETMPLSVAMGIYRSLYWPGLEGLESQEVATKILDLRVNFGISGGTRLAQQAANEFEGVDISEDGRYGPQTQSAINFVTQTYGTQAMLQALVDESMQRYQDIVAQDPDKETFLQAWLRRAAMIPDFITQNPGTSSGILLAVLAMTLLLARKA
jgi:lysozyme family protein